MKTIRKITLKNDANLAEAIISTDEFNHVCIVKSSTGKQLGFAVKRDNGEPLNECLVRELIESALTYCEGCILENIINE